MITIELPWPDKRLSPNSRCHWGEKAEATKNAKDSGWWETYDVTSTMYLPHLKWASGFEAQYIFHPPDRRKRDMDNCLAMMKPYQDGVCAHLGVDDRRIKRTVLEWGEVVKGGKVVLRLSEIGEIRELEEMK